MKQTSSFPRARRALALIVLAALFSAACALVPTTLPGGNATPTPETAATNISFGATGETAVPNNAATENGTTGLPTRAATAVNNSASPAPPQNPPPKPTQSGGGAAPTAAPPTTSNAPGGATVPDTAPPVIASAGSLENPVYYNDANCGPTAMTIHAAVTDDTAVDQVWVSYLFAGGPAGGDWRQANLPFVGGDTYEAVIDVSQDAANALQGSDGVIQYQVFARDAAGNTVSLPDGAPYGLEILSCGVLGAPPAPGGAAVTIDNVQLYPDPNQIYYGPCGSEPTRLTVQAAIEPLDQIASASIVYSYANAVGSSPAYTAPMTQLGIGEFAGDIDTGNAGDSMGTADGRIDFFIQAADVNGGVTNGPQQSVSLTYCSGGVLGPPPGNNPGNPGQGQSVVSFVNNSSQAIISLVIDGTEMFPAEPQGILPGDTYAVNVSDGSHSFTALNGWWESGTRRGMYTFSGSFTPQDGNVTFNDPTIQELLTNWGNYRYFQSSYMGNDGNFHFVGFCFYPDGTFREFDNGVEVDSGAYSEVSRGNNLVTTRLTGQSVSVDALYYETFALLDVPRGNLVDEYAPDDTATCP